MGWVLGRGVVELGAAGWGRDGPGDPSHVEPCPTWRPVPLRWLALFGVGSSAEAEGVAADEFGDEHGEFVVLFGQAGHDLLDGAAIVVF